MSDLARALLDELAGDPAALERLRELVAPPASDPVRGLMTVKDAAKLLGCHPKTVRRRIEAGVLPAVREQDRVVIRADDLDNYITRLGHTGAHSPQRRTRRVRKRDYDFLRGG
jgi:excisionase family DNA binding protein